MIAFKIDDIKIFTSKLFIQEAFDSFLVREVEIVTSNTYKIDGRIHKNYYNPDELEEMGTEDLSLWKSMKPNCFTLIKGNKLPLGFMIVLRLSEGNVGKLLEQSGLLNSPETINGLFLNIKYEGGVLTCVTGTSLAVFSMDKSLDQAWDQWMRGFFKENLIIFEEI